MNKNTYHYFDQEVEIHNLLKFLPTQIFRWTCDIESEIYGDSGIAGDRKDEGKMWLSPQNISLESESLILI